MKNTKIKVGTFALGNASVQVVADLELDGGTFDWYPTPTIQVGFNQNQWNEVVGILLHEAFEATAMNHHLRYRIVPITNYDSGDVTFMFNHAQYGRVCAEVGRFMADALPKLAVVYKKRGRK